MTAPKGTDSFTTTESKNAENNQKEILKEILLEFPEIEIKKGLSVSSICENWDYSRLNGKNKKCSVINADGGWLFIDEKLVGIVECKYQSNTQNACERAFKYLAVPEFLSDPSKIFISCHGKGFEKTDKGAATGVFIDMCKNIGITIYENPDNTDLERHFREWISNLIEKNT